MAFCKNCGQQMNDDAVFCANCGTPVENAQQAQQQAQQQTQQQAPVQPTVVTGDADVQQNRGIAWLSYVGLLFLVPLFARKSSDYCKFHVKQGATIVALELVFYIAKAIILAIINAVAPGHYSWLGYYHHSTVYNVFDIIFNLASIFFIVVAIMGIVFAAKGQKKELPLISKIPFVGDLMEKIYAALNK